MEELKNENVVEYNENEVEYYEDSFESDGGHGALIGVGLGVLTAAGVAAATFAANKTGKLDEFKERRRQKKIAKLEAKLEKEYCKVPSGCEPKETEEE